MVGITTYLSTITLDTMVSILQSKDSDWAGRMTHVVKCLPNNYEALSLNSSTAKKKTQTGRLKTNKTQSFFEYKKCTKLAKTNIHLEQKDRKIF
jgi:uncharacterized lipoprotein YddW (UPF0748 family)